MLCIVAPRIVCTVHVTCNLLHKYILGLIHYIALLLLLCVSTMLFRWTFPTHRNYDLLETFHLSWLSVASSSLPDWDITAKAKVPLHAVCGMRHAA